MKSIAMIAGAALLAASATAFANEADLDRRLQKLEAAMERIEARLAKLEASKPAAGRNGEKKRRGMTRGGMMGGGMMGGGMMGGGMMGGDRPNEQWRPGIEEVNAAG